MIEILGYVVKASSSVVRVVASSQAGADSLKLLGFVEEASLEFVLTINHLDELVRLFKELRSGGFAFSAGRDWSPSELFEYFRDQGQLSGDYVRIAWTDKTHSTLKLC